jgi:CNT family concentrative nucleoside transporter
VAFLGIVVILGLAVLFSENRKAINLRTVGMAFVLQASFAAFVLYSNTGQDVLDSVSGVVQNVINYSNYGIEFLFGDLGRQKLGFIFAFNVLPILIFFSALMSVLYYLGVMQFVVRTIGGFIKKVMETGHAESMSATANIFVGQTEAPLVVKPYLMGLTRSELFAVMVGGMASIAGSVMAGYANMGVELKYLIASAFMAAPGGLLMAKIIMPETDTPKDQSHYDIKETKEHVNVFDAAASGASSGLMLAVNVRAMLIAFIALIALLNGLLGWTAGLFGFEGITLELLLGWLFAPIAFLIGIPWDEAVQAGSLLGQKLILNEFVAYIEFLKVKADMVMHSQAIITFALCGFANLSSIAIILGGLGTLVPSRRHEIASIGLKALLAATLANLMSATLAGIFIGFGA